jgi:Bacterial Ig domain/Bacterial Ig-like domain (group 2)
MHRRAVARLRKGAMSDSMTCVGRRPDAPKSACRHKSSRARISLLALVCLGLAFPATADITVTVAGPGGNVSQTLPEGGGAFDLNLPLGKNMVNGITVTATDSAGNTASRELSVTQVSLADVVVSQFTSEPLSPERIEQLVNDGVLDLEDPENYNVSEFTIVLTIGTEQVPIKLPVPSPKGGGPAPQGGEEIPLPFGLDDSSGKPPPAPIQIIVFEKYAPSAPGVPSVAIPGVLIIDGRIKSLKEFYSCRLLLMNTSGIFTLSDVSAELSFPDGGLSNVLPADGIASFGDILPGDGAQPGQVEKEFIIRGDAIGVRRVQVAFGGTVTGPGIPVDSPIPFNGSALTDVEVKGPPSFMVEVFHPERVEVGTPYELRVDITNTGELPALYASLEIDVGGDGELVTNSLDTQAKQAGTVPVIGPDVRDLGHIYPGKTMSEVFLINPLKQGPITSCMAVSDQNIALQVYVGDLGCVTGHYPPEQGVPEGIPTVTVLPAPNTQDVGNDSPVAAFFSEKMVPQSIVTGEGGTFNVYNEAGDLLPGELRFDVLNEGTEHERTVAIWQFRDNITNRLPPDSEFTVALTQDIVDLQGNDLFNAWFSTFTTTGQGLDDHDPPLLTLSILPPVLPNYVLPGQIVRVNAYATDQGSGVVRVEARIKDLTEPGQPYQIIDQKQVMAGDVPPHIFAVDSANLVPGHTYQILVTAYDYMANVREATIGIVVAGSAAPPTISLPTNPALPVLQGVSVDVTPTAYTGGVREVLFYLDGAAEPFHTATLAPYESHAATLALGLGNHTVRAVAIDGLGQTGEDNLGFELVENDSMPVVGFGTAVDGEQHAVGTSFVINPTAEDPVGIESVQFYLDGAKGPVLASGTGAFVVDTTGLAVGTHTVIAVAVNRLGVSNDVTDPDSVLEFTVIDPPSGTPPGAPTVTSVSYPANGQVTVQGTTVANARVDVTNLALGITVSANASAAGVFSAAIAAEAGHDLSLVAYNLSQSSQPSATAVVTVAAGPALTSIDATPATMTLDGLNATGTITVTAHYADASTQVVTGQATFSSSAPGVASVNSAGTVVALSHGAATITVTHGGTQDQVAVTTNIVTLTSISVAPGTVTLDAIGQTQQLVVTGHYSDGHTETLTSQASFGSGNLAVATVSPSGLVTSAGEGVVVVSVAVSGVAPVTVGVTVDTAGDTPPTAAILSPATGTDVERNAIVTVSVRAQDSVGGVNRVNLAVTGQTSFTDFHQIAPPSMDTTETFSFAVSNTAAIGGTITVSASAEDSGGNTSPMASIILNVVDTAPPLVTIDAPAPQTGYNYGDTVTVEVSATDAVGVTQIRYETTGALTFSGSKAITPATASADAIFTFQVPYGVVNPDVTILAYATDADSNEGTATPVAIILTDADITPPETEATAVSNPGSGTSLTVSYQVTSGLDDLDHIELFFRRDGIGTFNRYTNAAGGNPYGEYQPQSGATGTIVFDSTRMGGDGAYEFYTVGVDVAGNREPAPDDGSKAVIADQTATFSAGTVWTTINTTTAIGSGDSSHDDVNLRIDGVTVTMSGHHSFHNVELVNGAILTHPETTLTDEYGVDMSAWTFTIDGTSSVNVTARGYLGGRHAENGAFDQGRTQANALGSTYRSGGSYGGPGANHSGGVANDVYGSLVDPIDLGSGGSDGSSNVAGGDGGGRILVQAINVVCDGSMSANGANGGNNGAGSGSGGSIKFAVSTVSGTGVISANGAAHEVGGGGGRIAFNYVDISTLDTSLVQALGGRGSWAIAANGTVFLKGLDETNGTLYFDGQGASTTYSKLPIPPGFVFDNIIIRNNARVLADDTIVVTDSVEVLSNSILSHSTADEDGARIEARRVFVDDTSAIDVSGRGYPGGRAAGNTTNDRGLTLGGVLGASSRSGGSYGGYGGVHEGVGSNAPYGHPAAPVYLGSGGSDGSSNVPGGHGGGRVTIIASDEIRVEGSILASGAQGTGNGSGSGSGGSIKIETSMLHGAGAIRADGAAYEVGGGGGRVAIDYAAFGVTGDDLDGLRNISAFGGHGSWQWGSAGTVLLRQTGQSDGDLYIDDNMASGSTASPWTPLTPIGFGNIQALTGDTLTVDGNVPMVPDGLAGLEFNPNIGQSTTFTVVSNTTSTITVDTTAKGLLTAVASVGDTYAAVYRFDNVYFRRGGHLVLGDEVRVTDTVLIDEDGRLDHYDATVTYEPWLDLVAGTVEVTSSGRIDVGGRGYLGGRHGSNSGQDDGRTLDNALGSMYRSGGSHGGLGAVHESGVPCGTYGNPTDPAALGSGGSDGSSNVPGGDGGGWVRIVADSMSVDGEIAANGSDGGNNGAGSGSGGTINITTGSLSGTGFIRANGAAHEVGGGGGRVAVRYTTLTLDSSHVEAFGGRGSWAWAGNGTIYLKGPGQSHGNLVVDGSGGATPTNTTPLLPGYTYDNIILRNNAQVVAGDPVYVNNSLEVLTGSTLTHHANHEAGLRVEARRVYVDDTSSINASGRGYPGGRSTGNTAVDQGITLGGALGASYRSGGSYGGYGGARDGGSTNPAYGHPAEPIYLGSGGSDGSSNIAGGYGGGRVTIIATEELHVQGSILANGANGGNNGAGSGSGGSIWIDTAYLWGTGTIAANGAAHEMGGGGGRVAVFYDAFGGTGEDLNGTRNITALGGHGSWEWGGAGTVLLRHTSQTLGDLYVDDNMTAGSSSPMWTPLTRIGYGQIQNLTADTLTVDGDVPMLPDALVGLELNPNITQGTTFAVVSNTATTITVDTTAKVLLTAVAAVGDTYAGVYRFDNVYFRRGGHLAVGDWLRVGDTMLIDEDGWLDHFDATISYEPHLDLSVGTLDITSSGWLYVDGRGYLGGRSGSNSGYDQGRTLGNALGSSYRSGGSYGGLGAINAGGVPNGVYGSSTNPAALGSGGSDGSSDRYGGDGGGWVDIVADTIVVDGVLSASGANGGGNGAGSGSGGTVNIAVNSLSGAGTIMANGAAHEVGGGGGRVAVDYTGASSDVSGLNITANGGSGSWAAGQVGSVHLAP